MSGPSRCNFFSSSDFRYFNDGAVTYYAQYGRTLHARAAAEPRNHMAGTVDCDPRRAFGSVTTIRGVNMTQLNRLQRLAAFSARNGYGF